LRVIPFSFPVPIQSVPLLDDRLTVEAAARQLVLADGQPAIMLDRAMYPVGLLFPHRLLDPSLPPGGRLGALSSTLLEVVPLVHATITLEMLYDCAQALRHPTARYVIAVEEGGQAIGVIDLVALPALESTDRDLSMIVERFTHEIASPLMGVLSLAALLGDERSTSLSELQQKQVQAIHHSATRMAYELERLDWVSRIYTGKTILYAEVTTLAVLFDQAVTQVQDRSQRLPLEPDHDFVGLEMAATTIAIDRRYGLHLFAAAIESVLGRYGSWQNFRPVAQVLGKDLILSLQSEDATIGLNVTSLSLQTMMPADRTEALGFLQILIQLLKGDLSLKPNLGAGFRLALLLPNVVVPPLGARSRLGLESGLESGLEDAEILDAGLPTRTPFQNQMASVELQDGDGISSNRAIVLTQRLRGHEIAQLDRPNWYTAIASSIEELLDKVARLSPRLVIIDCALYDEYHNVTQHLIRRLDQQAIAIATLRHRPNTIPRPSSLHSTLGPETFRLHYPLQVSEISSCFEWAKVVRSTIVLIDLHDPASFQTRSPASEVPGTSIAEQLRRHHCRTIEVNDLERAQLFVEIWQPQAIVLQCSPNLVAADWPQKIETLADHAKIPCLIFQFQDWAGQACRIDRSIVYWPEPDPVDSLQRLDIIAALQWLQHHNNPA
jgi:signal transduction histidine kinase